MNLTDYRGQFLLLHIGLAKNLVQAKQDLSTLKKENNTPFEILSIVSQVDTTQIQLSQKDLLYISPKEMQILRDSYIVENNANNYFLIDPEGKVLSHPLNNNSFKKLKSTITSLPFRTRIKSRLDS